LTDEEIVNYLSDNGYPQHVVTAGRAGLVERYKQFVTEVERGYKLGLEDYRNDLDLRAVLDLIGPADDVCEADERLAAQLTRTDVRVWESAPGEPFWDFGYPRNASGELLADLRAEGHNR
jgi:hypothetical protein